MLGSGYAICAHYCLVFKLIVPYEYLSLSICSAHNT